MPSLLTRVGILPAALLVCYPSRAPYLWGIRVFSVQAIRQQNTASSVGQDRVSSDLDPLQMSLRRQLERMGKHEDVVLEGLALAMRDHERAPRIRRRPDAATILSYLFDASAPVSDKARHVSCRRVFAGGPNCMAMDRTSPYSGLGT
jgi:hypothetical protein